jgi:hypothetical protein
MQTFLLSGRILKFPSGSDPSFWYNLSDWK